MPGVNLIGQPYSGRSAVFSGQQRVNLYPEVNDKSDPVPISWYQWPGTELFGTPLDEGINRCVYRTSIGTAYTVIGPTVYLVQSNGNLVFVGSIPDRQSQVIMADNGLAVVLVDGSTSGWAIDMSTNDFGAIIDPSFYGADFVQFLDTFFVFNRPDTNQFYISLGMVTYALLTTGTSFDPLDIAAKAGSADPIVAILTAHKELWLIGELTTEIWIGTGAADFYFQQVQGAFLQIGCIAPYSCIASDNLVFWLSQNKEGKNIIVQGQGYDVKEISTPYLVSQFNTYETTADAIGMTMQFEDHAFYSIVFPTDNITWANELKTNYWLQVGKWNLDTGTFDRWRANGAMFFNGYNMIGDYSSGKVYKLNPNIATDDDDLMRFRCDFQHMVGPDFQRVKYLSCSLNIIPGTSEINIGDETEDAEPIIYLSWSDDRGKTFGMPVGQSLGRRDQFLTDPQWNRLGMGRDRIFRSEWSGPVVTGISGGFVEAQPLRS